MSLGRETLSTQTRRSSRVISSAVLAVVVGMLAALLVGMSAPAAQAKLWRPKIKSDVDPLVTLSQFESRVLVKINHLRVKRGLHRVKYFQTCPDHLSESWATHISKSGDLVHRDQYAVLQKCDFMWTGETLIRGVGLTPGMAVNLWMHSPPHRAVLMKPRANRAGVAFHLDPQGRVVGVINFGDIN